MIECDCSTGDWHPASIQKEEIRTAAKLHYCCECSAPIRAGQRYEYVTGRWDGAWLDFRTCLPCRSMRLRYCRHGWIYGRLGDAIFECLGFDPYEVPDGDDDERRAHRG